MNCSICNVNKIGPESLPFGGFLCGNGHLQCHECTKVKLGLCSNCGDGTQFVHMQFNTSAFSSASEQTGALPTAPSLSLQSSFALTELPECCADFKNNTRENEIHSPSMDKILSTKKNFKESLKQVNGNHVKTEISEMQTIEVFESKKSSQISSLLSRAPQLDCAFLKKLIDDGENQSQLNEGHLSMRDSKESFNQWKECKAEGEAIENSNSTNISDLKSFRTQNLTDQLSEASEFKNKNIVEFEEDPNHENKTKSCEIQFLNSTDSLQNLHSNLKTNIFNATINTDNVEQMQQSAQKDLTKENLSHSETDSRAKVGKSVKSCDTYKSNISKATMPRDCPLNRCNCKDLCQKSVLEYNQKTVSVSTESDSSPNLVGYEKPDGISVNEFKPEDDLVMPSVAVAATTPLTIKKLSLNMFDRPSMEERMQQILETVQEQPIATPSTEKSNLNKNSLSMGVKQIQVPPKKQPQLDAISQLTNVYPAFFNSSNPVMKPEQAQQDPELLQQFPPETSKFPPNKSPPPAYLLNIPRIPIQCPDSACQRLVFVSDFNKHFVIDHSQLPMEQIMPSQCKHFFLDARLACAGKSTCQVVYLLSNKITDLGRSKYKDFLPILVMTSRISLKEMFDTNKDDSSLEFVIIWMTGIVSEEFPITVSLTVCPSSGVAYRNFVYSGKLYSVRDSQCALDVWRSGRMLMLSTVKIDFLTNNGKEKLNTQLTAH